MGRWREPILGAPPRVRRSLTAALRRLLLPVDGKRPTRRRRRITRNCRRWPMAATTCALADFVQVTSAELSATWDLAETSESRRFCGGDGDAMLAHRARARHSKFARVRARAFQRHVQSTTRFENINPNRLVPPRAGHSSSSSLSLTPSSLSSSVATAAAKNRTKATAAVDNANVERRTRVLKAIVGVFGRQAAAVFFLLLLFLLLLQPARGCWWYQHPSR